MAHTEIHMYIEIENNFKYKCLLTQYMGLNILGVSQVCSSMQVRSLVVKADDLNSVPKTYTAEREPRSWDT